MRKLTVSLLLLPMLSVTVTALAEGKMKAGLWEMQMKSDAMKHMPKISRQQMEQMRRMGINVPQMQDGGMVTKVCISKQMAERDQPPALQQKETGCETRNFQHSSSGYSLDVVCNGAMKGTGKAKGSFSGNDNFTSTYDFSGTMHGQPVNQHQQTSGKWLGADCGDIKPIDQLIPKQ